MSLESHWNHIYSTKQADEVSWYQPEPTVSLRLIDGLALPPDSGVIDIGGGDSRFVDHLLARGFDRVSVLDISGGALARAKARLGAAQHRVTWIEADVTEARQSRSVGLWHDRAVFHFLTEAGDRASYLAHLRRTVEPKGHVIMATFALDGPRKCSGLPVQRYSAETLGAEFGPEFVLEETVDDAHPTPFGSEQSFCYSHFRRVEI